MLEARCTRPSGIERCSAAASRGPTELILDSMQASRLPLAERKLAAARERSDPGPYCKSGRTRSPGSHGCRDDVPGYFQVGFQVGKDKTFKCPNDYLLSAYSGYSEHIFRASIQWSISGHFNFLARILLPGTRKPRKSSQPTEPCGLAPQTLDSGARKPRKLPIRGEIPTPRHVRTQLRTWSSPRIYTAETLEYLNDPRLKARDSGSTEVD
jgi:hypothetical protein